LLNGIDADCERLAEGGLLMSKSAIRRQTAILGHNDVFTKTSWQLAWDAEKFQVTTGILPAHFALGTFVTGNGGFDGNCIAGPDMFYLFADCLHSRGAFVASQIRVLGIFGTDSAREIIMDVAAANADNGDLQEDITIIFYRGLRQIDDCHLPYARHYSRLHHEFPGKTIVAAPQLRPAK
jgi:hypothetical protein